MLTNNLRNLREYTSLEEKQEYFAPATEEIPWMIDTEEEFDRLYDFLIKKYNEDFESGRHNLYFRGINEAKYQTFTSAQRHWLWNDWKDDSRMGFVQYLATELWYLRKTNVVTNFYRSLGVYPNDLLYLAFLQHYGGASPLLDLTHSPDTGLFFAFDHMSAAQKKESDISNYVSLQILDYNKYESDAFTNMIIFLETGIQKGKEIVAHVQAQNPNMVIDASLIEDLAKITAWYNPDNPGGSLSDLSISLLDFQKHHMVLDLTGRPLYWSNLRIIAQQGAFLFYPKDRDPIEKYFKENGWELLRCININKNLKEYVMSKINRSKDYVYPSEESLVKDANHRSISALKK